MKKIILSIVAGVAITGHTHAFEVPTLELGPVSIQTHGFASQGYMISDENNYLADTSEGTFDLTDYAINFSADIFENLHVGLQIYGRNLGDVGEYEPQLDWGYADYRFADWMGVRAGRMKLAYGLYNETRDMDVLRTSVFLPQGVYNETWRDIITALDGAGIYGEIEIGSAGSLEYEAQYGQLNMGSGDGFMMYLSGRSPFQVSDVENDEAYQTKLSWITPVEGLKLCGSYGGFDITASGTTVPSPDWPSTIEFGDELDYKADICLQTIGAEYIWENLTLAAEYFHASMDGHYESDTDSSINASDVPMVGYYGSAAYRFTDWFELGFYYSEFFPDADDKYGVDLDGPPSSINWQKDWCLTARFDFWENWTWKVEGHTINGTAIMNIQDNMVTSDDGPGTFDMTTNWMLFITKLTYSF